jgi:DNA primase
MRISQETVEQIRFRADILEVVGDFVSLKKKGANWWACCPFHNEKSPSFSVSPAKGIYKCFGCGAAGDVVKFVMDVEKVSYAEALRFLAKKYDIKIQEEEAQTDEQQQRQNERDSLFIILNFAKKFYEEQLFQTEDGKSFGMSYFKERGFSEKTIQSFELGYSPNAMDIFTKNALKNGYSQELLEKAGLTLHKEYEDGRKGNPYDRFRDRVIFPIHNISGRVIAFGARILTNDKNQPKYINSPETDVYHKSQVLYGIFQAKNAIRQDDLCYLTEGYTDVISLHQAGIQNVVASSGTSLTTEQIKLIGRFTKNITLLYDGDNAGIKAALRGTDMILEEGMTVKIVTFPDNDDPDSYVKKVGSLAFKEFVQRQSQDLITFKTNFYLKEANNDPFKKAEVISELVKSITKIPDPIARSVFFKQTATRLEIEEQILISESNKLIAKLYKEKEKNQEQQEKRNPENKTFENTNILTEPVYQNTDVVEEEIKKNPVEYQEEECIRLLISYADEEIEENLKTIQYILEELENVEFVSPVFARMLEIFRAEWKAGKTPNTQFFIHHPDTWIQAEAIRLITHKYHFSENWKGMYDIYVPKENEILSDVVYSNILRLNQRRIQRMMNDVMNKLKTAETEEDQEKYLKMYKRLKDDEMQIAKFLGNVLR